MQSFYTEFIYAFIAIFPIVNPIGMAAIFYKMTYHQPPEIRQTLARQIACYAFVLLVAVLLFGSYILKFFGLSISLVQIAGGLVVFHSAWDMLNNREILNSAAGTGDSVFFPLTMPITIGTGTIAITLSLAGNIGAFDNKTSLLQYTAVILAILCVCVSVFLCYYSSEHVFKKLGTVGANVVTKLSAFILLAIGTGIIWNGINGLVH